MLNIKRLADPPEDCPKAIGLERAQAMLAAPKTGWALLVGHDPSGQPLHWFRDEIVPPNALRRKLTWLLTGMKWVRVAESSVA